MKKTILVLVILSLFSCKKEYKIEPIYNEKGEIIAKKYLDSNHELDSIICFKNGKIDSKLFYLNKSDHHTYYAKFFRNEGKLSSEGFKIKLDKNNIIKTGKWKYYDSKMRINRIIEYINLCGKEHPNQIWEYDEKGSLLKDKSTYFSYQFNNAKMEKKKTYELKINYVPEHKNSKIILIMSPEFDENFCNINNEKFRKAYIDISNQNNFIIHIGSEKKGKIHFTGYIKEDLYEKTSKKGLFLCKENKTYIDIPLVVN